MIKCLTNDNSQKLLNTLNHNWVKGIVPHNWRRAIIIPIHKPGKPATESKSYRPIALTSVLCKIFERMVNERLIKFIIQNKILHPLHLGFLPFKGCDVALFCIFNHIIKARAEKKYVVLISLDITGAYDSVWHDGFALKALQIGLPGHMVRWIHQFLSNRTICVRWADQTSANFKYLRGTPQGSVLSPTIYTIYKSDLLHSIPKETTGIIYADDIFLICSSPSRLDLQRKIDETIHSIEKWCREWKLKIEPSKCAIIEFSNKKNCDTFNVSISNNL